MRRAAVLCLTLPVLFSCNRDDGKIVLSRPAADPGSGEDTGTLTDSGATDDTGTTEEPDPDFFADVVLTGGPDLEDSPARLAGGTAQLAEDTDGFRIVLEFTGATDTGVPIALRCAVPFEFQGAMYPENSEYGGGELLVGCAELDVGGAVYDRFGSGLTTWSTNDGSVVAGSFELQVNAADGGVVSATGTLSAALCGEFWSGATCSY